jgi:Core-2/I-Branching enzyme
MAHKNPLQIERFLKRFDHEAFDFYIHLDRKVDILDFAHLQNLERVYFIKNRTKVRWASYSFVQAILTSFEEILNTGRSYQFISVMSGQDYPLKPVSEIYHTFTQNQEKNFICYEETDEWWKQVITRITRYHLINFDFKGKYKIQSFINAIMPDRKFPLPYTLYGGPRAMCMTLSSDCARYVTHFVATHGRLRRFSFFTWGPDEFLIPTIVMNSPFRDSIINDNFYYIDWSRGGSNPKTLTAEDFDKLMSSDKLMARKFDTQTDAKILDLLDHHQLKLA